MLQRVITEFIEEHGAAAVALLAAVPALLIGSAMLGGWDGIGGALIAIGVAGGIIGMMGLI